MAAGDDDRLSAPDGAAEAQMIRLLEQIRDNQTALLQGQNEALALQREHVALARQLAERNERLQERAERLQEMSGRTIATARKALIVILPVIAGLILYLTWLLFR